MANPVADDVLLRTWLHNRPITTSRAYRADMAELLRAAGKSIPEITLDDLQTWISGLERLAPTSRARRIATAKSLFRFGHEVGVLTADPARSLRVPRAETIGPERSLTSEQVARMIDGELADRRRAALQVLYLCGLRASEACALTWRNMTSRPKGTGEMAVLGKGGKKRTLHVRPELWRLLASLNPSKRADAPVLPGRDGQALTADALHRTIKHAAKRAGLPPEVSAHWLRHAFVSHALDRGCPPHVVQKDAGHASLTTTGRYAHVRPGESASKYLDG